MLYAQAARDAERLRNDPDDLAEISCGWQGEAIVVIAGIPSLPISLVAPGPFGKSRSSSRTDAGFLPTSTASWQRGDPSVTTNARLGHIFELEIKDPSLQE
jgi:hypothetical protein